MGELFAALNSVFPFVDKKILQKIEEAAFTEDLLSFEDKMVTSTPPSSSLFLF